MHDELLRAIEVIYDCVGKNYDFEQLCPVYSRLADDSAIVFGEVKPFIGAWSLHNFNVPDEAVRMKGSVITDPASNSYYRAFPKFPIAVPVLRRTLISDEEFHESRIYKEVMGPYGLHGEGGFALKKSVFHAIGGGFFRHPGQEELGPETLALMGVLNEHMHRALAMQDRLDHLEEAVLQANGVLDLMTFGLVLYGSRGETLYVNAAAKRIFADRDGLSHENHGLVIDDREARDRYKVIMEALFRPNTQPNERVGGLIKIPRPSRRKAYSMIIAPTPGRKTSMLKDCAVAMFMLDPKAPTGTAIDLFVSSYGLTEAEARLARDLAYGLSLDEISNRRRITRNTAKTQLQSLFAKTETRRQAELVGLLLRSVAGIHLDKDRGH